MPPIGTRPPWAEMSAALIDGVFKMAASARVAAKSAGWNQTADRDVWTGAGRTWRLTAVGRDWCWTEVKE